MRKIVPVCLMILFCLTCFAQAAEEKEAQNSRQWAFPYVHELGVFTGFAGADLAQQGKYRVIPIQIRLGYNLDAKGLGFCDLLRPLFDAIRVDPKGFTEFLLEVFANTVVDPNANIEAGCTILLKYSYPLTEKIYPYALAGGGGAYLSQHTREQAVQWGFTPQIGAGISYFLKPDMAVHAEYRYRHFSNAGIKEPNEGINADMFLIGISWFY